MDTPRETKDLLALRAMPEVAVALRQRIPRIIELWNTAVARHLPHARELTVKQVRNSIPAVMEKIAQSLESDRPEDFQVLLETGTAHGMVRFQEDYSIEEVLIEYRVLRRITFDQLQTALAGHLTYAQALAIDMAIDTALQQGVTSYVHYLTQNLQSAAAAEAKYLSFLSHDLRNNLNGVTLTLAWMAQRLAGAPEFREIADELDSLQNSITETTTGMDRLLQAERLRRDKVDLQLSPVDLHKLAADLLAQQSRHLAGKPLTLVSTVPKSAGSYSDRELVTLVLQNLLGNAVKYSSTGTIRLAAEPDSSGWRVSVSDQGPGISAEHLATLFDAFTRGQTHGQPGLGLGLTIASHAARRLGSELSVTSKVGQGSTFSFTLPPAENAVTR